MPVNEQTPERQRAEIRKLVDQLQRAVRDGRVGFSPELDYRIREQLRRNEQEKGIER